MFQRLLHLLISAVLILPPALEILGLSTYGTVANQILTNIPNMFFGGMPPSLDASNWFFYNLSIAVGVLYLACGLGGDDRLAMYLCIPRFVIGMLNVGLAHKSHPVNYYFGGFELCSAVLIWNTLPKTRKKTA